MPTVIAVSVCGRVASRHWCAVTDRAAPQRDEDNQSTPHRDAAVDGPPEQPGYGCGDGNDDGR